MRAAVLPHAGADNFTVTDTATTAPLGRDRVRVRMHRASLCHSDLSVLSGVVPHPLPCVGGHEGAGEVVEIGDGVGNVAVGDRVIIVWLAPCGRCVHCVRGEGHLCADPGRNLDRPGFEVDGTPTLGLSGKGTFVEETVVASSAVFPIPDDLPYDLAALIGCGVTTGVGAVLNTAQVQAGSTVVVVGLGGVGISIVQGARVAGASRILAVDPVAGRREWALRFGATHAVAPDELDDARRDLTGDFGFDYAFEAVGQPTTLRAAFDAARRGGTVCLVGAGAATAQVDLTMGDLMRGAKRILPSMFAGGDVEQTFHRIIRLWRDGLLDLEAMVTHHVDLDDINTAIEQMRSGEALRTVIDIR